MNAPKINDTNSINSHNDAVIITGNNLAIGGDEKRRTVLVKIPTQIGPLVDRGGFDQTTGPICDVQPSADSNE